MKIVMAISAKEKPNRKLINNGVISIINNNINININISNGNGVSMA
jgi:hypothetical protein